jgi:hypothetical protein
VDQARRYIRAPSHDAKTISALQTLQNHNHAPVYNGRPGLLHGPPIEIYHPAFATFKDLLHTKLELPSKLYKTALTFVWAAAEICNAEADRQKALNELFKDILDDDHTLELSHHVRTNTAGSFHAKVFHGNGKSGLVPVITVEYRNELGAPGGGDPAIQAGFRNRQIFLEKGVRLFAQKNLMLLMFMQMDDVRNASACPSLLISIAGPHLIVSGFVFADIVIQQPLSPCLWIANPFDSLTISSLARLFHALREALRQLRVYYRQLVPSLQPVLAARLPCLNSFRSKEGENISIEYLGRMLDLRDSPQRAIFRAKLTSGRWKGTPVVVKFVESYNERAHELLASNGHGLAPRLHHFRALRDNLHMVVMDHIDGEDA